MVYVKSQPWWQPGDGHLMEGGPQWNMWTRRLWPYNDLEEGDHILCVSAGGPDKGEVRCEAELQHLIKAFYESKDEAWKIVRTGIPKTLTKQQFMLDQYTLDAPSQGWLLASFSQPVRPIGMPRPADLKLRPNGWGEYQTAL